MRFRLIFGLRRLCCGAFLLGFVFAVFTIVCVFSWTLFSGPTGRETRERETQSVTWRSVIDDTNFVTAWVAAAFLVFEMTVHIFSFDLESIFGAAYIFLPLIAIVVGFYSWVRSANSCCRNIH